MNRVYYYNSEFTIEKKHFDRIITKLEFTDVIPKVGRIPEIIKERGLKAVECAMSHYYRGIVLFGIKEENCQIQYFLDIKDSKLIKVAIDF